METSTEYREVRDQDSEYRRPSNVGTVAILGVLGVILIVVADLHVLGLI